MKKWRGSVFLFVVVLTACRDTAHPPAVARQFSDIQLAAEFPADLGPDQIDVSSYPPQQQANYTLFSQKCAQCHTLARPINALFATEAEWTRYVTRMHGKAEDRFQTKLLDGAEAKKIIGFLVFDSNERKLKHSQEFQRQQEELKEKFKAVQAERIKVQTQRGRENAVESGPYVGDKGS